MGREATYYGRLSTVDGNALFLPFYGVSSCAVNIIRADNADNLGEIYAQNIIPKVWDYDAQIYQSDSPQALYGFPFIAQPGDPSEPLALSTSTVAKEEISGVTLVLTGGALQGSNLPVARLQGKSFIVPPTVQVVDNTNISISGQENAGLPWAVEGWIFRSTNTSAATVYIESNAGVTNYLQIILNASGTLGLVKSGVVAWTAGTAIPLAVWTHFAISSNGTQITYMQDTSAAVVTAYTHAAGLVSTFTSLNLSSFGQHYSANIATYRHALTAAQFNRHHYIVTGSDYYSGGTINQGGTLGQGGSVQIIFTNTAQPSFNNPSVGVWGMVLPLQGVGLIRVVGATGEYVYEVHTEESDV